MRCSHHNRRTLYDLRLSNTTGAALSPVQIATEYLSDRYLLAVDDHRILIGEVAGNLGIIDTQTGLGRSANPFFYAMRG